MAMTDKKINFKDAADIVRMECGEWTGLAETIVRRFKKLPTVDAVPVRHGHWIYHPDWQADGECGYECSECGMGSDVDYPYCMLCGARMERKGR